MHHAAFRCGGSVRLIFLTLTQIRQPDLRVGVDRLWAAWRRLRRTVVGSAIVEGTAVVEAVAHRDGWHVHLHVVAASDYMDKETLMRSWASATGDGSFMLDIGEIEHGVGGAIRYLTGYLTMPPPVGVAYDVAMRGRRYLWGFGARVPLPPRDPVVCLSCGTPQTVWLMDWSPYLPSGLPGTVGAWRDAG